jgi:hypothetical protein
MKEFCFCLTFLLIHTFIRCLRYTKTPANALGCNFIAMCSLKYIGQSSGHLQGCKNKNTNINRMYLNHYTIFENQVIFGKNSRLNNGVILFMIFKNFGVI